MKLTPAMKQYMDIKHQYPDALLLFRMGDFYETFYDDAKTIAEVLQITLTARGAGETKAPLAGIPYHALDRYLGQLVKAGLTIAICEQLEDPKKAKGVVKRGVTRIVTPGTVVDQDLLDAHQSNYLCALFGPDHVGYAAIDISTGNCIVGEAKSEDIQDVLKRLDPTEVIYHSDLQEHIDTFTRTNKKKVACKVIPMHAYSHAQASQTIKQQFSNNKVIKNYELAQCALGAALDYAKSLKHAINHVNRITLYKQQTTLILDDATLQNLEILTNQSGKTAFSLLNTIKHTKTAMGARMLKEWLVNPLYQMDGIRGRHGAVRDLIAEDLTNQLQDASQGIADIERICSKVTNRLVNPKELIGLQHSIDQAIAILQLIAQSKNVMLQALASVNQDALENIKHSIQQRISPDASITIREGNIIAKGFDSDLDELRSLATDSKKVLADIQKREQSATGIPTLKVKYNKVFGYFIEVTAKHADSVPAHYTRKQTLTNAERFVTDELKELEHKIMSAQEKSRAIEYEIYQDTIDLVQKDIDVLYELSNHIAQLDVLTNFAYITQHFNYCIPEMTQDAKTKLVNARHPVVEQHVDQFIPNDTLLNDEEYIHVLTGPNMAGKSTYMRQVALCVLLAHCGCGVPADSAKIQLTDRIFTRIGARDDVSMGQSTFMVEMQETATILNYATKNSLVLLDEIGRGTSTFDGVALAYAIAEDLRTRIKAHTLFATHYHTLIELGERKGAKNYNIEVAQSGDDIVFLHKVIAGGTDKSYGIHVAQLAGLPHHVVQKAQELQIKFMQQDDMQKHIVVQRKQSAKDKDIDEITLDKQRTLFD